jgi:hypothetical protein
MGDFPMSMCLSSTLIPANACRDACVCVHMLGTCAVAAICKHTYAVCLMLSVLGLLLKCAAWIRTTVEGSWNPVSNTLPQCAACTHVLSLLNRCAAGDA